MTWQDPVAIMLAALVLLGALLLRRRLRISGASGCAACATTPDATPTTRVQNTPTRVPLASLRMSSRKRRP